MKYDLKYKEVGAVMHGHPGDLMTERYWKRGQFYECRHGELLDWLYANKRDNMLMMDCGAHWGNHTVFCLNSGIARFVVALEPYWPYELRGNVRANKLDDTVDVRPLAVYDTIGEVAMTVDSVNSGGARIGRAGKRVDTTTIDSMGIPVEFLKIDVEDSELSVLLGAVETLKKYTPMIAIETHDIEEITEFLDIFKYRMIYKTTNATPTYVFD